MAKATDPSTWNIDDPENHFLPELRVAASILAERAGLAGRGITYADLVDGDHDTLDRIIKRCKRKLAA